MPPLPIIPGAEAVKAFGKLGWLPDHQTDSHVILYKRGSPTLSVPNHRKLAPGLVRSVIRRAGITVEEFIAALGR
jgi:predicted RNA binding protein YcfA (HicA-like mRNA interferase family)